MDNVRKGDFESAKALMASMSLVGDIDEGLKEVTDKLNRSKIKTINLERFSQVKGIFKDNEMNQLTYELVLDDGWLMINVVVEKVEGKLSVAGLYIELIDRPLSELNAFNFTGKGWRHYLMLVMTILVPLFSIITLVICILSKMEKKWLWVIFLFMGIGNISMNWTNGAVEFYMFSLSTVWAPGIRDGLSGAWYLSYALPVGPIAFVYILFKMKKLEKKKLAKAAAAVSTPSSGPQEAGQVAVRKKRRKKQAKPK
ncbi:MAG: hypothetical protein V3T30_01530 [Thermodesulfobacteriota bacterium]